MTLILANGDTKTIYRETDITAFELQRRRNRIYMQPPLFRPYPLSVPAVEKDLFRA
jgi:hypothetical protein